MIGFIHFAGYIWHFHFKLNSRLLAANVQLAVNDFDLANSFFKLTAIKAE